MRRAVIFANGRPSDLPENRRFITPDDFIIAADGGANHALELNIQPHVVIGDMDSITPENLQKLTTANVELKRYPVKKDQTDLELAIDYAIKAGFSSIKILTAFGGRLDQLLANIFLITRPEWQHIHFEMADYPQQGWLLHAGVTLTINGEIHDTLSVIPLTEQITGLTLTGVEWPLERAQVQRGSTLTISNTLIKAEITTHLQTGTALVLLQHK